MVCSASTSLMDSMAALQIMDPRMDSGIYPIPPHLIADCDKFPQMNNVTMPPFDPSARLSATEICWIMDRLLACEVDWHKGASLSQTIHTCLYVHSLSSISPRASQVKGESPNLLVCRVLRPFLMALLKSVGLVWDEVSKGNLIDGEDFNCDKGRISLLEEISLNEVEAWLGDAISYIQALGDSRYHSHYSSCDILTSDEAEALLIRIQLRGVSVKPANKEGQVRLKFYTLIARTELFAMHQYFFQSRPNAQAWRRTGPDASAFRSPICSSRIYDGIGKAR